MYSIPWYFFRNKHSKDSVYINIRTKISFNIFLSLIIKYLQQLIASLTTCIVLRYSYISLSSSSEFKSRLPNLSGIYLLSFNIFKRLFSYSVSESISIPDYSCSLSFS